VCLVLWSFYLLEQPNSNVPRRHLLEIEIFLEHTVNFLMQLSLFASLSSHTDVYVCVWWRGEDKQEDKDNKSPGLLDEDERGFHARGWGSAAPHARSRHARSRTERAFEKRGTGFLLGRTDFPFRRILLAGWLFLAFKFQFTPIFRWFCYAKIIATLLLKKKYYGLCCVWRRRILFSRAENWTDVDGHH